MCVAASTGSFSNCSRTVNEWLLSSVCLLAIVVALLSISSTNDVVIRHLEGGGKCRAALLVGFESGGRIIDVHSPICTLPQAAATQKLL
jgi:hypothetical protein